MLLLCALEQPDDLVLELSDLESLQKDLLVILVNLPSKFVDTRLVLAAEGRCRVELGLLLVFASLHHEWSRVSTLASRTHTSGVQFGGVGAGVNAKLGLGTSVVFFDTIYRHLFL